MADTGKDMQRVIIDGKFFRLGEKKFYVKGVTYGPFAPNEAGEPFPEKDRATADFKQITAVESNVLRVYHVPPRWLLDLAHNHGLKFLVDVPWWQTGCFLDAKKTQEDASQAMW
jgi:hypothetical protein